jgi:hypothetical protein
MEFFITYNSYLLLIVVAFTVINLIDKYIINKKLKQ